MQFEALCPFVRYASKTTYLPNRFLVKARDCRLFYVLGGSGKFITSENSYPLSPGSLVLYPAGHAYRPVSENELLFYTLNFDYNTHYTRFETVLPPCKAEAFDVSTVLPSHADTGIEALERVLWIENAAYLANDLEELVRCFATKELYWRDMTSAILKKILLLILRRQNPARNSRSIGSLVTEYLHTHYAEPLSNASLAKAFGYHPYHLERLFKTFTGQTLHAYLLELRLEKALELVMNTVLPVGEIASRCGFVSAEHFSTAFRKKYGLAPSRFCTDNGEKAAMRQKM